MVDGYHCKFPDCDIRLKYLGENFVSCSNCIKNDSCLDTNYGLGCYNGENYDKK